MKIFESLRKDHDIQRGIVDTLRKTDSGSPMRKPLFECLKLSLSDHADAEERFFYAPLMKDDMTQKRCRHSIAEHQELDKLMDAVEQTHPSSEEWIENLEHLAEKLHHHLEEEEREVFQLAGKSLSESKKTELAQEYREEMGYKKTALP